MATITALERQKRRPDRVSVFVDGAFAVGLSAAAASDLGLEIGRELAEDELRRMAFAAEVDRAYARALRYWRNRLRSRHELEQRLRRYGYDVAVVAGTVELLAAGGLVDDRAFAGAWVRDRVRLKPKGRRALRVELAAKGVAREDVEAALAENVDEGEEALAKRALAPRLETLRDKGERKGRAAAMSFLARRGFNADLARRLADELFST
ncbi:MAG: regulatory protein RecX [bacterium]